VRITKSGVARATSTISVFWVRVNYEVLKSCKYFALFSSC